MSMIPEIDLVSWIDTHIDSIKDHAAAEDYIISLCTTCTDLAFKAVWDIDKKPADEKELYRILYLVVERVDQLWVYAGAHMREKHGVDLFRFGALVLLQSLPVPEEYREVFRLASEDYANMLDKKTSHSQRDVGGELLREYFDILNRLGTYHSDYSKYKTDEQRDLARRLLEIYNSIMYIKSSV